MSAASDQIHRLTHERLLAVLRYEPGTGLWFWRVRRGGMKAGDQAGTLDPLTGYIKIYIDGVNYYAHRLAWFYVYGVWPDPEIDHKDTVRGNNKWENLREGTRSQNEANIKVRSANPTCLKGVTLRKDGKFASRLMVNYKERWLGLFDCPAAAHFAYVIEADKAFGEFARPK